MDANERSGQAEDGEDVKPVPPRYRWLKRIGVGVLVWIVLMGAVRLWWGRIAEKRLAAEIAKYQAAGEPIFPEDFDSVFVPDDENGAKFYLDLDEESFQLPKGFDDQVKANLEDADTLDLNIVAEGLSALAPVLNEARAVRAKDRYDWGVRMRSPLIHQLIPSLGRTRSVVRLLCGAALYEHRLGNDAAAVEYLRDAMPAARAMDHLDGFAIAPLVAGSHYNQISSSTEYLAADLRIAGKGQVLTTGRGPASREAIEALLDALLDEASFRRGSIRGMQGERSVMYDIYRMMVEQQVHWAFLMRGWRGAGPRRWSRAERAGIWLIEPFLTTDAAETMERMTLLVKAAGAKNHEEAKRYILASVVPAGHLTIIRRPMSSAFMPAFGRAIARHFQTLSARRQAAVALAVRLYELDHGRRAASVEDLVPDYLPAVPLDPMFDDGTAIELPMDLPAEAGKD